MAENLQVDLRNYKDTQSAKVAPGPYTCIIEDADMGVSSQKKTVQLELYLRIIGGPHDGENLVEMLYPKSQGAMFRTVAFLKAMKIKTPKENLSIPLRSFINRRVNVVVVDREYPTGSGKFQSAVDEWLPYTAPADDSDSEFGEMEGLDEFAGDGTNSEIDDLPEVGEDLTGSELDDEGSAEDPEAVVETAPEPEAAPEPEPEPEPVARVEEAAKPATTAAGSAATAPTGKIATPVAAPAAAPEPVDESAPVDGELTFDFDASESGDEEFDPEGIDLDELQL
jgi:hypothetical protein